MAYATTIYPARVAIDTLLRAWSWPDGTPDILWGAPTEEEDVSLDLIYQGPPNIEEIPFTRLGGGLQDELYALRVFADVRRWGDEEQVTEARAWSHVDQILSLAKANLTLSGTVNRLTGFEVTPVVLPAGPQQWRAQVMVQIGVVGLVAP